MSNFKELAELNVNNHTEKKGRFTYLSWAWAHDYLGKLDPEFDWWPHDFPATADGQIKWPYMATPAGCFVRVTVKFKGKERTHTYPILNHAMRPIESSDVNAFDVNTSIMRCFTKVCALHGLGLYIFAKENVPGLMLVGDTKKIEAKLLKADTTEALEKAWNSLSKEERKAIASMKAEWWNDLKAKTVAA